MVPWTLGSNSLPRLVTLLFAFFPFCQMIAVTVVKKERKRKTQNKKSQTMSEGKAVYL